MNTIQITTDNGAVNYTEGEVARFIDKAKEVDAYVVSINNYQQEIRNLRNNVRDFFSEVEWSDGEQTVQKHEVNDLLERIGSHKLTSKYRGTFTITGTFEVEAESEDDVDSIICDNTEISNWSADMDMEQIETNDIEEDN